MKTKAFMIKGANFVIKSYRFG